MIEIGKCYKTTSFNGNVYIFRVKDFTIKQAQDWIISNKETQYYYINVEIGFIIENDTGSGIKKIRYPLMKDIETEFIEIEEKDMDKLVHYYNIMEQSFNSIINKYK